MIKEEFEYINDFLFRPSLYNDDKLYIDHGVCLGVLWAFQKRYPNISLSCHRHTIDPLENAFKKFAEPSRTTEDFSSYLFEEGEEKRHKVWHNFYQEALKSGAYKDW